MQFSVAPKKNTPRNHIRKDELGFDLIKQNVIAHKGKCRLIMDNDVFFGTGKAYCSRVLENPTWGQIMACARTCQKKTGDYHHDFLEGIYEVKKEGDITVLRFIFGS